MALVLVRLIELSFKWFLALVISWCLDQLMRRLGCDTKWIAIEPWLWVGHGFGSAIKEHDSLVDRAILHVWHQRWVHAMSLINVGFVEVSFEWGLAVEIIIFACLTLV